MVIMFSNHEPTYSHGDGGYCLARHEHFHFSPPYFAHLRLSPLEIVTNLHSKRKTEQMVLFDQGTRFYGADANSMAARKPNKIPAGMSVMLGREAEHPTVKVGIFIRLLV